MGENDDLLWYECNSKQLWLYLRQSIENTWASLGGFGKETTSFRTASWGFPHETAGFWRGAAGFQTKIRDFWDETTNSWLPVTSFPSACPEWTCGNRPFEQWTQRCCARWLHSRRHPNNPGVQGNRNEWRDGAKLLSTNMESPLNWRGLVNYRKCLETSWIWGQVFWYLKNVLGKVTKSARTNSRDFKRHSYLTIQVGSLICRKAELLEEYWFYGSSRFYPRN